MELIPVQEKALLIGLGCKRGAAISVESLDELAALADTAGAEVVHRAVQNLPRPDNGTYIGRGKVTELAALASELDLDLVIVDAGLSPSQLSHLNEAFPCRVLDRNQLILDIFAQRAMSREGKLQVELAQLSYLLPRLAGHSTHLSRLGGGIGTRGPGESKLEEDRRHLRTRIAVLRSEIDELRQQRQLQRKSRERGGLPQVALVGYTNAGKSTLMNRLAGSNLLAEDKLFATLDTTTRRAELSDGRFALLSDTVGFIRNLPTHLIAAFRATLEELQQADLLLHVVDISAEDYQEQMEAVQKVLDELEVDRPVLLVFNKIDRAELGVVHFALHQYPQSVAVAAATGENLDVLITRMQELLYASLTRYTIMLPYSDNGLLEPIYATARILRREEGEQGVTLELESDAILAGRLRSFVIPEGEAQWQAITED